MARVSHFIVIRLRVDAFLCVASERLVILNVFTPVALILEEIAIDCHNKETEQKLLQEAHDLHLSSLQLAKKAFGEFNVQTAKHYGNLGRLYQSMRKFKVRLICTFCVFFFLYLSVSLQ